MKEKISGISVFTNLVLAIGKIIIGSIANSTAILAEGLHSGMDIFSSGISYIGIKKSKKPADKEHPYGHYKFEVLSGLIITLILFITGIWIIYEAYRGFVNPTFVTINYLSLGVMLFSAVINGFMAKLKIYYGKKENSVSLLSDGFHSRIDVLTSIAVLIGIIISGYLVYADSLLALLIGFYIIKESFSLGKEATDSLLDVSAGEEIENEIKKIAEKEGVEISDLKTQKRGSIITANLEIKLPKDLTVDEATRISNKLRDKLIRNMSNLKYVSIQIKSHKVSTGFYKSWFGRGFGWQRRGRMKETIKEAKGLGPGGYCICPKCEYKIKHERGIPCSTLRCPKCNVRLIRK